MAQALENTSLDFQPCKHCGLESKKEFCCLGCRAAYGLIEGAGLQRFYKLQSQSSANPIKDFSEKSARAFDDEKFLDAFTTVQSNGNTRSGTFPVGGLHCTACVWLLEKLPQLNGECLSAFVNFQASEIELEWKSRESSLSSIANTLARLGYDLQFPMGENSQARFRKRELIRLGVAGASAAAAMHVGLLLVGSHLTEQSMAPAEARWVGLYAFLAALPAIAYGGIPFFRSSYFALKVRRFHPDLLVAAALVVGGAFSLHSIVIGSAESYFDSLAMVVFLLLAGRWFIQDSYGRRNSSFTIPVEKISAEGNASEIPSSSLAVGDHFRIRENQMVPLDSRLLEAEAWVDESVLTGETTPRRKLSRQEIRQGSKVLERTALLEVLRSENQSSLSCLKSGLEARTLYSLPSWIDQLFTLGILSLTAGVYGLTGDVRMCISLLVVSCPCAFQLGRPLALAQLRAQGLKRGVAFLRLARILSLKIIQSIAFDKTGTLTQGAMTVERILRFKHVFDPKTEAHLVCAMTIQSEHPIAKALAFYCRDSFGFTGTGGPNGVEDLREVSGEGIFANYQGRKLFLGKPKQADLADQSRALSIAELSVDEVPLLQYQLRDKIREELPEVITDLASQNPSLNLAVFSGDPNIAEAEFSWAGMVQGGLSPLEKAELIENLPKPVLMVGDGFNDSLAFQKADLSLGFSGSAESSIQSADVYLLRKDLRLVPAILRAIQRAYRISALNITISILYNVVAISFVFSGYLGPVICAILMPLSSLSVIAIASRASYFDNRD